MTQYAAAYTHEDPLSAARGMVFGGVVSLMLWAMILTATGQLG